VRRTLGFLPQLRQWREDVLGWVRTVGINTVLAHFQQDPCGRQCAVDWNAIVRGDNETENE